MKKVCYLHLGFHKTATTSFQLTIQQNRKLLEQEGIVLPKFLGKKQKFSANHSGQIRDVFDRKFQHLWESSSSSEQPSDSKEQTIQDHCHRLAELLKQEHNILMSGEGISTMPKQSLNRLKATLEDHGFLIQPFALVRAPYAYLTSALQQTIKNGKHQPLIRLMPEEDKPSDEVFKIPNSLKPINTLHQIFGDGMNYIPFQKAATHPGGPVLYLLQEVLKLKQADQYQLINANESKSNVSTRLKNFLNQQQPHADQGELRTLFKSLSLSSQQDKFLLTKQEFARIESEFNKVKREMRRKLGKEFVNETIAFSSNVSAEETTQLLAQLSQKLYAFALKK